jgi:hypothetical protein
MLTEGKHLARLNENFCLGKKSFPADDILTGAINLPPE